MSCNYKISNINIDCPKVIIQPTKIEFYFKNQTFKIKRNDGRIEKGTFYLNPERNCIVLTSTLGEETIVPRDKDTETLFEGLEKY